MNISRLNNREFTTPLWKMEKRCRRSEAKTNREKIKGLGRPLFFMGHFVSLDSFVWEKQQKIDSIDRKYIFFMFGDEMKAILFALEVL